MKPLVLVGGLAALGLVGCADLLNDVATDVISAPKSKVRVPDDRLMTMAGNPHALMTRPSDPRPGDRARADSLADAIAAGIARFRDVADARAAGYEPFPAEPPKDLHVVHFVNRANSRREADGFDADHPGALLYEQVHDGPHSRHGETTWRLVGAMITAPIDATVETLDTRVPLSVAQWHLHQNVCVPDPIWDAEAWARKLPSGEPVFGPDSPIYQEAACEEVGGDLLETVFGWMVHAYVFAADSSRVWDQHH